MLVCQFYAAGVHASHRQEVQQRSQHRLHGLASYSRQFLGLAWVFGQLAVHSVVVLLVHAVVKFLEIGFLATAPNSKRTSFAACLAAAVGALGVALAVNSLSLERQQGTVAALLGALVAVLFLVERETLALGLVLTEVGNVGINVFPVEVLERLAAAVACIGQQLTHSQTVGFKVGTGEFHQLFQALAVALVGKVGAGTGDHVVGIVNGNLPVVVELPCLAGLNAYPGIGVGGAVVGVVRKVLGPDQVAVVVNLVGLARGTGHCAVCSLFPLVVALNQLLAGTGYLELAVFFQLANKRTGIFQNFLLYQRIHGGVGLYEGTVNGLPLASYHTLFNAQRQDLAKQVEENLLAVELARAAYGGVPRQLLVEVVTQKKPNVEAVAAVAHQCPVAAYVVEVANKQHLEENHRVNAGVSLAAVKPGCGRVEEAKVQLAGNLAIEVIAGYESLQAELVKQSGGEFFSSLHGQRYEK